jgi:hypothetical protein
MRDNFPSKVINTVSRRAGFHCSNPECRKLTVGSNTNKEKSTLIGVAAHITAASPGGPRYESSVTPEERSGLENAIWLCANCSTLVDKDPTRYTVAALRKWKDVIERDSADGLLKNSAITTIGQPVENPKEMTWEQQAEYIKEQRKKQQEVDSFLDSRDAIIEAKNQVKIIIEQLKRIREVLQDPSTGLHIGIVSRQDDMYGIGYNDICLRFNWNNHMGYDLKRAILNVSIFRKSGHHGINYTETPIKVRDYRYTRSSDGVDGWIFYETGKDFKTTQELVDEWSTLFISKSRIMD